MVNIIKQVLCFFTVRFSYAFRIVFFFIPYAFRVCPVLKWKILASNAAVHLYSFVQGVLKIEFRMVSVWLPYKGILGMAREGEC